MSKLSKGYIDVSRKTQIEIIQPSKKSQERARERVKSEFRIINSESLVSEGVVIIRRLTP